MNLLIKSGQNVLRGGAGIFTLNAEKIYQWSWCKLMRCLPLFNLFISLLWLVFQSTSFIMYCIIQVEVFCFLHNRANISHHLNRTVTLPISLIRQTLILLPNRISIRPRLPTIFLQISSSLFTINTLALRRSCRFSRSSLLGSLAGNPGVDRGAELLLIP